MLQKNYKITSKNKFSNQKVQFWYLLHPALSYSLPQEFPQTDNRDNRPAPQKVTMFMNQLTDCYLRQGVHPAWQGAHGTEFARNGSRACFLMWFYKRSQTYFGQKPEEHNFSIKQRCLEVKNNDFSEKCVTLKRCIFLNFSRSSRARAGPIWAQTGPYGPIWTFMGPYGPEKSQRICKQFAFIGAFKVPCTLP